MKSFYSTKLFALLILPFMYASHTMGQNLNISPYSVYGLGDPYNMALPTTRGMGSAQVAMTRVDFYNSENPASLPFLGNPTFDVGLQSRSVRINGAGVSGTNSLTNVNHFAMGFPFGKRFGLGFNLMPYSTIGYEVEENGTLPSGQSYRATYQGNGSVNQMNLAFGAGVLQDSSNSLTLGINGQYLFGHLDRFTEIFFPGDLTAFNSRTATDLILKTTVAQFVPSGSMIYKREIKDKYWLNLAAVYTPQFKINAVDDGASVVYQGPFTGNPTDIIDTTSSLSDTGEITLPMSYKLGASLNLGNKFLVNIDYRFTDWARLDILGVNQNLESVFNISGGVEFWPDYTEINNILKFSRYRIGARYGNSRITSGGDNLSEFGINLGLTIPMMKSASYSGIHFGIEYGQRGAQSATLNETFTNLSVGLTLIPSKFDRWFYKRKID